MKKQIQENEYSRVQRFADITKQILLTGNLNRAKKCFLLAEKILLTGNRIEKNAISNVFIFGVSSFMELHRFNIRSLFPSQLQVEYFKQVNTSGV